MKVEKPWGAKVIVDLGALVKLYYISNKVLKLKQ